MANFEPITSQEQFDEMIKDRLDRQAKKFEAEKAELKGSIEGYISPEDIAKIKADYDKQIDELSLKVKAFNDEGNGFRTQLEEKEAQIKKYELDALKLKVALSNNIPYEFANRLQGTTEKELKEDALTFANAFSGSKKTAPSFEPDEHVVDGVTAAFKALNPTLNIK